MVEVPVKIPSSVPRHRPNPPRVHYRRRPEHRYTMEPVREGLRALELFRLFGQADAPMRKNRIARFFLGKQTTRPAFPPRPALCRVETSEPALKGRGDWLHPSKTPYARESPPSPPGCFFASRQIRYLSPQADRIKNVLAPDFPVSGSG